MKSTLLYSLMLLGFAPSAAPAQTPAADYFESKVRPLFAEHCFSCHGDKKQQAGLRLDQRTAAWKGSDEGPVIVPGHPEKSPLVQALRHVGDVRMPPKGKLPAHSIETIAAWIKAGAVWPDEKATSKQDHADAWKKHWAFQPVKKPAVPAAKDPATPIDAFIHAKLESKGLEPNPVADKRTLIRRLKFDLVGLPPTFEEVAEFEKDTAPDAYAKLVDRFLSSPHYGERWARYWLDVARYADTKGYVFQEERRYAYAYGYRDYVIKAYNDDLPYDRFVEQQIAADRLVAKGEAPAAAQAAMGFLTLGRRFLNNVHDIIDDRIDLVGRGLMGLTISCARCHDHKYDPIPTQDYYSLYGVFASSTEPRDLPIIAEPERTPEYVAFEAKLNELKGAVEKYREEHKSELASGNRKFRDGLRALQKKVDAFQAASAVAPLRAMVLQDTPSPMTPQVFVRGNPKNPGPSVPRQFVGVLSGKERTPFQEGSGRLELARAIADNDNPLTARVYVNRVWTHLLGRGLVTTPGDFGLRSDPPSHPELLDYLAARFVEDGWSTKKLIRNIVLSKVYRQSSAANPAAEKADPENRYLARANRRRLDFEAMRDGILAACGTLDPAMFGAPVDLTKAPFTGRRTLYGFIDRQNLPGLFRTFDFASPDATTAQRYQTTVPQQALFLLNSTFLQQQVRELMKKSEIDLADNTAGKIQSLHRRLLAREARPEEIRLGEQFLASASEISGGTLTQPLSAWERYAQVLLLTNEFMFVD